ncbi:MAG: hypothetical protein N3F09_10605 [Bacteroidia bacterium]|nr:hypothetical protein [Bacteroidia bacterium]
MNKVYIKDKTEYYPVIKYVLKLIEKYARCNFVFTQHPDEAHLIWDDEHPQSEPLASEFYANLKKGVINKNVFYFSDKLFIADSGGKKDSMATIFYMVNCIQELNADSTKLDEYGRFKYHSSYQYKFNVPDVNLAGKEMEEWLKSKNIPVHREKSSFFISHDIDSLYGSLLQDGFWALKKMRIGVILKLIAFELSANPHWRNIDKIIKINSEYDVRATFFWLVNRKRGMNNVKNADYKIEKERDLLKMAEQAGSFNGLHKSACADGFEEEAEKLGIGPCRYNRYHFLKFLPHKDWDVLNLSGIKLDCSLGFAEHYGFRNSYGKAFQPFDVRNLKPYRFVVAPLTFMDGTFQKYMNTDKNKIFNIITDFYFKNPENCDFSLLWHNTFFTDYKYGAYLNIYKKILSFIYENKIPCKTPEQLIQENILTW